MNILATLERKFRSYAARNLTMLLIAIQVSCLVGGLMHPPLLQLLGLHPDKVLQGEIWRIVTFLAVPIAQHPLWAFFF